MIAIIDYGMGNLHSVYKAFELIGADVKIVTTASEIADADKVVLPGVGAFRDAIETLERKNLTNAVIQAVASGKWFMGICLGMQILLEKSYEDGCYDGLGIIPGEVVKFDFTGIDNTSKLKIPHMGWNSLDMANDVPLYKGIDSGSFVYFVHSYYVSPESKDVISARTSHGIDFTASLWKDNVLATQFHPEKSQAVGLKMLKNFASL